MTTYFISLIVVSNGNVLAYANASKVAEDRLTLALIEVVRAEIVDEYNKRGKVIITSGDVIIASIIKLDE